MRIQRIDNQNYGVCFCNVSDKSSSITKRFLTFNQSEGKKVNVLTEKFSKSIKTFIKEHKKNKALTLLNLREKGIIVSEKDLKSPAGTYIKASK